MLRMNIALATIFSLAILLYVFFILYTISLKPPLLFSSNTTITMNETHDSNPRFSLLTGILTCADKYDHRNFLRLLYGIQSSPLGEINENFVFCNLTNPEQRVLISLEIIRFHDIIILNCYENMNSGNTYAYFSSLPQILPRRYDYVMKGDDDVYLRHVPLAFLLNLLPTVDFYYGFMIPCTSMNLFVSYMSGMGFLLSWDLVEWISVFDISWSENDWMLGGRRRTGSQISLECKIILELMGGVHMILF